MTTSKNTSKNTSTFLEQVFVQAKTSGQAHLELIKLLQSGHLDWSNKEIISPVAREFRLGRMLAYLGLESRAEALLVNDKKAPSEKVQDDSRRTAREQQAYRAAVSAWEHAARMAGMPKKGSDKPRGAKKRANVAADSQVKPANSQVGGVLGQNGTQTPVNRLIPAPAAGQKAPTVKDGDEALAFVRRVARMCIAFQKANAKVLSLDLSEILARFEHDVAALAELVKEEHRKTAGDKPAARPAPLKKAA